MCTLPVIVGLDYSDRAVQVCVLDQAGKVVGNRACDNDWQAIVKFAEARGTVIRAAIESCSGAANLADELVMRAGWHVDLAHPGYVARMKQSPDKTDYQDARLIADLERVGYLPRVWVRRERKGDWHVSYGRDVNKNADIKGARLPVPFTMNGLSAMRRRMRC